MIKLDRVECFFLGAFCVGILGVIVHACITNTLFCGR